MYSFATFRFMKVYFLSGIEARLVWMWDFGWVSGHGGRSLLPWAHWTVLAGETLMYELQVLLPLPVSTEKQVC